MLLAKISHELENYIYILILKHILQVSKSLILTQTDLYLTKITPKYAIINDALHAHLSRPYILNLLFNHIRANCSRFYGGM